jgi:hypothetical protein
LILSRAINKREKITFADLGKAKGLIPSNLLESTTGLEYSIDEIESAIGSNELTTMRDISNYFFRRGGIYSNLIQYKSDLISPKYIVSLSNIDENSEPLKIVEEGLDFADKFSLDKQYSEIIKDVLKDGASYRYYVEGDNAITLQKLPTSYCRSRFQVDNLNTVEFDPQFFDREFRNAAEREQVLKMYPKEIQKAYTSYKNGSLERETDGYWVLLDTNNAVTFTFNGEFGPPLMSVITNIIDLKEERILTKKRMEQELRKILVQKIPTDKEGNFLLSSEESKSLHKFAKEVLGNNDEIDVLTTFADTDIMDIQDSQKVQQNTVDSAEQSVFTEAGVSSSLFNSDSNTTQKSSILRDIETLKYFISSIEVFLNKKLREVVNEDLWLKILPVSIHTVQEQYDRAIEGATYGMPTKMMAAIYSGITQKEFLELVKFENDIMKLSEVMKPLKSSHTQTGADEGGAESKGDQDVTTKTIENNNGEEA